MIWPKFSNNIHPIEGAALNRRLQNDNQFRVCFVTSHPIQYQVPVFRLLAQDPRLDFTVLFCQLPDAKAQGDGFGVAFEWDIPLLDGYRYEVMKNISRNPSVTRFSGCDTPEIFGRIRRRGAFDAVVVNGWGMKSSLQALWACRRAGVPCLVRGESNDIRPRSWWKRLIQKQLVHTYAGCLNIGEANRSFYLRRGVSSDRIFAAPYCVDNDRLEIAASAVVRADARQQFGLRDNSTVFLFCGKLEAKKHPLHLLQAVRGASVVAPRLEVLIVGDGELRRECEQYVVDHALPVRFAGFLNQSQIVEAYVAADGLVLPSDHGETWGLVVNEAMACGRGAIVSDQVGCAKDLVIGGTTGEQYRFGDCEQLAALLQQCSREPERLRNWGECAKNLIEQYSPAVAAEGIYKAIEFACEGATGA